MPDAGEQLHDEEVEDLPLEALAVAAQRDIDVLPEPAGQGHVPAPPEFRDGARDIGVVEVLREIKAQHLAHADGHHGIAGKVEIQLQGIGDDAQPDQRRGGIAQTHIGDGGAVLDADDVGPERAHGIRQQDFLRQTEGEQGHALLDLPEAVAMFVDMQLSRDIAVFDDGACDELREHDHIGPKINDVVLGLHIPAVDINGVGKGLEGVEADAQRQGADALNGRELGAEQAVQAGEDEVRILKIEQHPQAPRQSHQQQRRAGGGLVLHAFQPQAAEVVDEDEGQHDREKPDFAPAVEHQTAHKEHGVLEFGGRKVIERQRDGEKPEQKKDGAENQGVPPLKKGRCRQGTGPR